jgi:hypothetical protein
LRAAHNSTRATQAHAGCAAKFCTSLHSEWQFAGAGHGNRRALRRCRCWRACLQVMLSRRRARAGYLKALHAALSFPALGVTFVMWSCLRNPGRMRSTIHDRETAPIWHCLGYRGLFSLAPSLPSSICALSSRMPFCCLTAPYPVFIRLGDKPTVSPLHSRTLCHLAAFRHLTISLLLRQHLRSRRMPAWGVDFSERPKPSGGTGWAFCFSSVLTRLLRLLVVQQHARHSVLNAPDARCGCVAVVAGEVVSEIESGRRAGTGKSVQRKESDLSNFPSVGR